MSPYSYIRSIFRSDAAKAGHVVRRSVQDINKYASLQALVDETKSLGFHLIQAGDQYIVVCRNAPVVLHF